MQINSYGMNQGSIMVIYDYKDKEIKMRMID